MKIAKVLLFFIPLVFLSMPSHSAGSTYTDFDSYRVVHTVFNSSFIKPEIAVAYNLTRGKDKALVNIALVKNNEDGMTNGLPANISGSVANLMQQQKTLEFIEIKEQDATYYLAPLRFDNEEVLHFNINVQANGKDYDVKFSKKLYVD